jgi:UDP-N-acetyl-D-glucosamine dehydrogenase
VSHFREGGWTAGVVGLGYVGLPLCITAWKAGLKVIGFDVSEHRVEEITSGRSHIVDVSDEDLQGALEDGFEVTTDASALSKADAVFLCVPSPLGRSREPDMSYIESATSIYAENARPGQLVSLESTTYPGTLEDVMVPALEAKGLTIDEDVYVAFSPERVDPGNELKTNQIPKVVGGLTPISTEVAAAAYGRLVAQTHIVSSSKVAEMTKLLENTYRAVNIGLVNELAMLANELDIDIWEVIDAAKTKPFGYQAFYPGPGVGGHCIPLDPQYLAWRARQLRFPTRFIDVAEQTNAAMPVYVVDRIAELLNENSLPIRGSKILAVGIAYKPNVTDNRESAAIDVVNELVARGGNVLIHDPVVGTKKIRDAGYEPAESIEGHDLAVILTDHEVLDYGGIASGSPLIFDTRNAYRRRGMEPAGLHVL